MEKKLIPIETIESLLDNNKHLKEDLRYDYCIQSLESLKSKLDFFDFCKNNFLPAKEEGIDLSEEHDYLLTEVIMLSEVRRETMINLSQENRKQGKELLQAYDYSNDEAKMLWEGMKQGDEFWEPIIKSIDIYISRISDKQNNLWLENLDKLTS